MSRAELVRFAAEFRRGILGPKSSKGMCFAVCAPLSTLLAACGVQAKLVMGWVALPDGVGSLNHYWLSLPEGFVLDPTADQFNKRFKLKMPAVYLGKPHKRLHRIGVASCL